MGTLPILDRYSIDTYPTLDRYSTDSLSILDRQLAVISTDMSTDSQLIFSQYSTNMSVDTP